ncbi:hypothetical protein [Aequorivita sediminis]|uniref:hypothetical protein n=1 Tax=Aequorivita sediminis TaxID=3073653 RepID=UPI0028AD0787|nr:hypothetical protein [Aequorivita sp. F6058]
MGYSRFNLPKTVLFIISGLYVLLMIATYILYYKEPVIVCAERMLIAQGFAIFIQIIMNYIAYRSKNKIVILSILFISTMLFLGALSGFFNLGLMCEFYGY